MKSIACETPGVEAHLSALTPDETDCLYVKNFNSTAAKHAANHRANG
jgi:hypothetical protein